MTWSALQPFATGLLGIAALATFFLTLRKDRHPLTTVERLTQVAAQVQSPEVRRLVEDYRDEKTADWVLARRAPAEGALFKTGRLLQVLGGAAFAGWLTLALLLPTASWVWALYAAALVLLFSGAATLSVREAKRQAWARQERQWRGIAHPVAAEKVTKGGAPAP